MLVQHNLPYILGALGVVLLLGWFARLIAKSPRLAVEKQQLAGGTSAVGQVGLATWMLVQGAGLPEFVPCTYDRESNSYNVRGAIYPAGFVRTLQNGRGLYILASHCYMPRDGNLEHGGEFKDLVAVPQAEWTASWQTYDKARRDLNWAALWNRGDGSSAGLKTLASGLTVVVLLVVLFKTWGITGAVARNSDNMNRLESAISAIQGGAVVQKQDGTLVPPKLTPVTEKK